MCENIDGISGIQIAVEASKETFCKKCKVRKVASDKVFYPFMLNGEIVRMFIQNGYCKICMTRDFIGYTNKPKSISLELMIRSRKSKLTLSIIKLPKIKDIPLSTSAIWGGNRFSSDVRKASYYVQKKSAPRSLTMPRA